MSKRSMNPGFAGILHAVAVHVVPHPVPDGTRFVAAARSGNRVGVQFHPESILTRVGHDILRNFLVSISPEYKK